FAQQQNDLQHQHQGDANGQQGKNQVSHESGFDGGKMEKSNLKTEISRRWLCVNSCQFSLRRDPATVL
ncbi:hypothetical protein, partial [Rhodoferax sp.]|uniref:hypothetical protein n=1 Tax=Rhodoferax sp. TaxID=50421 RepID=UPI003BB06FB5